MRHDDDRLSQPVAQLEKEPVNLLAVFRIEVARRLIGQQYGRRVHQCPRDGHPLLLPSGEFGRFVVPPTSKPEHQEKFPCLLLHLHPVATPYITRHADILESGKLGKQVVELKDESYPAVAKIGEFPVGEPFDRNTVYAYTTAVGRTERTEYLEQRSLARTAFSTSSEP